MRDCVYGEIENYLEINKERELKRATGKVSKRDITLILKRTPKDHYEYIVECNVKHWSKFNSKYFALRNFKQLVKKYGLTESSTL